MSSSPSEDMTAFKELLSSSKHIIAVAGAGLSAASGSYTPIQIKIEMSAESALQVSQLSEDLEACGGNTTR
jgi:hypothetical protein